MICIILGTMRLLLAHEVNADEDNIMQGFYQQISLYFYITAFAQDVRISFDII